MKTFDTGTKLYSHASRSQRWTISSDTTCWENPRKNTPRRSHENETRANTQGWHHFQPKTTLSLWIFFFIYCSTFLFLLNIKLSLILKYLIPNTKKMSFFNVNISYFHIREITYFFRVNIYKLFLENIYT